MKVIIRYSAFLLLFVSAARAMNGADSIVVADASEAQPQKQGFVGGFLADEGAIWTSPLQMGRDDAYLWGGVAATTVVLFTIDEPIARDTRRLWIDNTWVRSVSPVATQFGQFYLPYGIAAGFCLEGIAFNDPNTTDTGILAAEAMLHSGIVVQVFKHLFGRSRPFVLSDRDRWYGPAAIFTRYDGKGSSPYDSFPSGHTITAFTLATIIAGREQTWMGVVAYSCAGLCAISRLTMQDHWLSDVFVGGTLGVAIGKLELSRHNQDLAIYPSVGSRSASLTLQLAK
ncbi:MAG TPA: phosphatase PAP2 family protein [Bacteroidota bacterium]|nr:phosphatase PAP2 family protein [Bacteroidota bacterium]